MAPNAKTGTMVDKYPKASPKMMLVAAPVWQEVATSLTGLYEWEVMYSVKYPMTSPAQSPAAVQTNACHGSLTSFANTASPNLKDSGRDNTAAA